MANEQKNVQYIHARQSRTVQIVVETTCDLVKSPDPIHTQVRRPKQCRINAKYCKDTTRQVTDCAFDISSAH